MKSIFLLLITCYCVYAKAQSFVVPTATGGDNTNKAASTSFVQAELASRQPLNTILTTIAGLTLSNDNILQVKAGAITQRTPAQLKTDLAIVQSDIPNLVSDISGKQTSDADLTTIAGITVSNDGIMQVKSSAWTIRTPAQVKTDLVLVKGDVGLGNVDNTSDATKFASPSLTGTPTAPTAATGTNTTQIASTAFVQAASNYSSYQTLLEASGSHTAAKVAGTYALGDGDPLAVSGTGILYPIKTIFIAAADYPSVDGKAAKLRLRVQLYVNDVAPTGNFTFGLYPITRPGTSGGAGLNIYTLGTVVTNSTVLFTAPAADGLLNAVSVDFALPSDGHYVIGVVTTATVAASSHVNVSAILQKRNN